MNAPYTPDEFNVRLAWITSGLGSEDALNAEFDRFIASIKAEAWQDGWNAGVVDEATECTDYLNRTRNPYRIEDDE